MRISDHLKHLYRINRDYLVRRYQKSKVYHSAPDEFFRDLPKNLFEEYPVVFVLSTGRCGTQLLTRILETSEQLDPTHTPSPELFYGMRQFYKEGMQKFDEYRTGILMARYDLIRESYLLKRTYVETHCKITFAAPHLKSIFKKAKFIHLVRNPYSFIRSAIATGYYQSHKADVGHIFPYKKEDVENWKSYSLAQKAAWNWNETNQFIEDFKTQLNPEDYLKVTAEDLFSDVNTSQKVLKFCGCENFNAGRIKKLISQKHNSSSKKVKTKIQFSDEEKALIDQMLTATYKAAKSIV